MFQTIVDWTKNTLTCTTFIYTYQGQHHEIWLPPTRKPPSYEPSYKLLHFHYGWKSKNYGWISMLFIY